MKIYDFTLFPFQMIRCLFSYHSLLFRIEFLAPPKQIDMLCDEKEVLCARRALLSIEGCFCIQNTLVE